jgi:hypothetical protein
MSWHDSEELNPNIAIGAKPEALLRGESFKGWQEMHLGKAWEFTQ